LKCRVLKKKNPGGDWVNKKISTKQSEGKYPGRLEELKGERPFYQTRL